MKIMLGIGRVRWWIQPLAYWPVIPSFVSKVNKIRDHSGSSVYQIKVFKRHTESNWSFIRAGIRRNRDEQFKNIALQKKPVRVIFISREDRVSKIALAHFSCSENQAQQQWFQWPVLSSAPVVGTYSFSGGTRSEEPTCLCRRHERCRFSSWVREILWRRAWQPTPLQRSCLKNPMHRGARWATVHGVTVRHDRSGLACMAGT